MDAETDADALAGHVMAVIQGMSTLARDGAAREKLTRVAATAMLAWPARPIGRPSDLRSTQVAYSGDPERPIRSIVNT